MDKKYLDLIGKEVQVRSSNSGRWFERVFVNEHKGMFYCVFDDDVESYQGPQDPCTVKITPWEQMQPIPDKKKRTMTVEEWHDTLPYRIKDKENRRYFLICRHTQSTIDSYAKEGHTYDTITEPNVWREFTVEVEDE